MSRNLDLTRLREAPSPLCHLQRPASWQRLHGVRFFGHVSCAEVVIRETDLHNKRAA